jgi:hypothetical protein
MDLVSMTIGLPLAPVRGLLALARVLQEEAETQLYDPTSARRELEELETAEADQRLSADAAGEREQQVVDRLLRR